MTAKRIDVEARQGRLDWMRAEFRAAQQRRYETRRRAINIEVTEEEATSRPEAGQQSNVPSSTDM